MVNKFHNLSNLLFEGNYSEIEFHPNYKEVGFEVRLKNSKGNWELFYGDESPIVLEGYSFQFPFKKYGNFTIAERKNKKYIYFLREGGLQDHIWFDSCTPHYYEFHEKHEEIDEYGNLKYDSNNNIVLRTDTFKVFDYLAIRRNDKWAIAFPYPNAQRLHQLTGFHFSSPQAIPDSIFSNFYYDGEFDREYIDEYEVKTISKYLQENEEIDIATYFGEYSFSEDKSHAILKVRHAKTKRWSIQILGGFRSETEFPIAASKIKEHEFDNGIVLEAWCDDKVGYYFYNGKDIQQVLPCEYDDFNYVHLDYTYGCALKKNGKWELYNAHKPIKPVEGKAETIDELIDLWLDR